MKNKKLLGIGFTVLLFSRGAAAGVPTTPISQDFDIGTLTSTPYENSYSVGNTLLQHSYTFDLAEAATVDAWLLNPRIETGNIFTGIPPLTITRFDLAILDSQNHVLFDGTHPDTYPFGSTLTAHVSGVLPAGNDFYVRITGGQMNDTALAYQINMRTLPVPEPESYALFMAGLGLLGWRLRRSKK